MSSPSPDLLTDAKAILAALGQTIAGLHCSVRSVHADLPPLFPQEAALLSERAVEKRRREFHAGRIAARDVLEAMGISGQPIGKHTNRAPLWPQGVAGSISHSDDIALAVAKRSDVALGVDLELNEPLSTDVTEVISTAAERSAFASATAPERIIFSAKESVYKCLSLKVGRVIDFSEVAITPNDAQNRFEAIAQTDLNGHAKPGHIVARGMILTSERHILTFAECAV